MPSRPSRLPALPHLDRRSWRLLLAGRAVGLLGQGDRDHIWSLLRNCAAKATSVAGRDLRLSVSAARSCFLRCLRLLGLDAAGDGIKNGQLCLLNGRNGIIDSNSRLPLQSLGVVLRVPRISVMLCVCNVRLQGVHIGSDFCSYRSPVSNGRIANGLDFLIHLLGRLRGSSTRLLLTCLDFILRLLLGGGHRVFGILSADGQVGELLGECLSHAFPPS